MDLILFNKGVAVKLKDTTTNRVLDKGKPTDKIVIEGKPVGRVFDPRVKYISSNIKSLSPWRARYLLDLIPRDFLKKHGGVIAGGCLRNMMNRNEEIADVDVYYFGKNDQDKKTIIDEYESLTNVVGVHQGDVSRIGKYNLVFVLAINNKKHPAHEVLLNDFDFNVCRWAYNGEELIWNRGFARATKKREIKVCNITSFKKTLQRLKKYEAKGYKTEDAFVNFEPIFQTQGLLRRVYI